MKNITTIIISAIVGAICAYATASLQNSHQAGPQNAAAPSVAPPAQKLQIKGHPFEYNIYETTPDWNAGQWPAVTAALNGYGAEGWEVCGTFNGIVIFKRQK